MKYLLLSFHNRSSRRKKLEACIPKELEVASQRLNAANQKLDEQMFCVLSLVLTSPHLEMRRKAIDLLLSWRSNSAMELFFQKISKYDAPPIEVNCTNGILCGCQAFCCKFFVRITDEDLADGVQSHPGLPYMIRITPDGCYALDTKTGRCTIWEKRPLNCRLYSCKTDKRVSRSVARPLHARSTRQL